MEWFFGIIAPGTIFALKKMMTILNRLLPNFLTYQMAVYLLTGGYVLSIMEMVMSCHCSFLKSGARILLFMSVL
ncbi:MAG: hypothetical protein AXW13_05570 [Alcanivorax sp. Nap_24]|nr:MAG: hypothetical protein AXW13_05570 [Alcanivorax sp. Nap_24]